MQRLIVGAMVALIVTVFVVATSQAGVPILISHQGLLTDGGGTPVNGPHTLTFRIFESPVGGAPLWTEDHVGVAISEGLFTVSLGSLMPLNSDVLAPAGSGGTLTTLERYLEVQVDADPALTPRTRLIAAPYSVAAGRVAGDIETQPSSLKVRSPSGNDQVSVKALDGNPELRFTQGGVDAATLTSDDDSSSMEVTSHRFGRPAINTARAVSGGLGAVVNVTADLDGDGIAERGLIAGTTSIVGSPGTHLRGWDSTADNQSRFALAAGDSGSSFDLDSKPNPQAARDNHLQGAVDVVQSLLVVTHTDTDVDDSVTVQASRKGGYIVAADYKLDGSRRAGFSSDSVRASAFVEADANGDGSPESRILQNSRTSGANLAIKTKGTGAQRYSVNLGAGTDSSSIENGSDEDGDGRENSVFISVSNALKCGTSCLFDLDDDGVADNSVAQMSDAVSARLAIKTKGTGAQRRSATLDAVGDSGITFDLTSDSGGVGGRSGSQHHYINLRQTVSSLASDIDGDGTADHTVTESTNDSLSSVVVTSKFHNGPRQTTSQDGTFSHASSRCATDSDNDGIDDLSAETYSDSATARMIVQKHLLEPHEARLQVNGAGPSLTLTQQAVVRCLISPDSGMVLFDASSVRKWYAAADGDLYAAGDLKVGTTTGAHHIDVVGGAYCDGTNWVNASDANSKEHFQAVDGGQLLDRLMQLPINRWNYKGQTAAEHIGPTAQDFRATFGVGADNKSISTIDPSGIALAAIQELNRQNLALQNQNRALKSELNDLRRKVDALLAKQ